VRLSPTRLLARDELIGFARSKVMLVLWIILPCIALAGFLLLPARLTGGARHMMTATQFMSLLESSIAGLVAGVMIAVDIVNERNRNVYPLLVIRPMRREVVIWSKLVAVTGCVAIACIVSVAFGMVVDFARGTPPTVDSLYDAGRSLVQMTVTVAMSTSAGALIGVLCRSILVAVILVFYVGQNIAILPQLPTAFGLLPDKFWWFMVISFALVVVLVWLAGRAFRRTQL
jgi:ABC-type transport system involved in multi-copper enzyme maturation permease subunit